MQVLLLIVATLLLFGVLALTVTLLLKGNKQFEKHRKECHDWVCKLHEFGLNLIGLFMVGRILYHMGNPITAIRYGRPLDYDFAYQGWTLLWWLAGIVIWSLVIIAVYFVRAFYRHRKQLA